MILFLAAIAFAISFLLLGALWSTLESNISRIDRDQLAAQLRPNAARMAGRHYVRPIR